MNVIRTISFCAILLYLPEGVGQIPAAGPGAPAGNQEAVTAAEGPGTGENRPPPKHRTALLPRPRLPPLLPKRMLSPPGKAPLLPLLPRKPPLFPKRRLPPHPRRALPLQTRLPQLPRTIPAAPAATDGSPADAPGTAAAPAAVPAEQAGPDFSTARAHLVVVKDGLDAGARQAPGFSISGQGHVLAYAGALRARDFYLVSVSEGQVFTAELLQKDDETGLMLLKVNEGGHGLSALKFARTALEAAAPLYAVKFDPAQPEPFAPVAGTVSRLPAEEDEVPLIVHNALFNAAAAGAPLLNRCYQAVGVNVLQRTSFPQRTLDPEEAGQRGVACGVFVERVPGLGEPHPARGGKRMPDPGRRNPATSGTG